MMVFYPPLDIDDFYVRLFISSLLSFDLVIILQQKRNPGVSIWVIERGVVIHLYSIKVVDKLTKLCLASRSLKQWVICWFHFVILSHPQNFDAIIMLLCHLTIPDSGMMFTKLRYIEQNYKTTSLISSFQKKGHNRFYNYPWYVTARDNM